MLVCLCQSFKQSVANDRTTNFFFSHPRVPRRRGVSVFSLFFPFFPFLFTLQIYLLYKLLRHCVDIQVCLLLTILAPDVSTPLFLLFLNYTRFSFVKSAIYKPSLRFHLYKSKCAKHFSPQRKLPSLHFSLALYSPLGTILTK